jgi:hypothetical protein
VTQIWAGMVAALEHTATHSGAYVLRFNILPYLTCEVQGHCFHLPPKILAVSGFFLSRAAALSACVPAAIQMDFAYSQTLRRLIDTLVTNGTKFISSATAFN